MMGTFFDSLLALIQSFIEQFKTIALPAGVFAAAGVYGYLRLQKSDLHEVQTRTRTAIDYAKYFLILGFLVSLINLGRPVALATLSAKEQSNRVAKDEGDYSNFGLMAPYVAKFYPQTFTREYAVTEQDVKSKRYEDQEQGILPGYEKVSNTIKRVGDTTTLVRTFTMQVEERIPFKAVNLSAKIDPTESRTNDAFTLQFEGTYEFENPDDEIRKIRFRIPIPNTQETIENMTISVNGERIEKIDSSGSYEWLGTLEPKAKGQAKVSFKVKGGGQIIFDIAEAQRPVNQIGVRIESGHPLRFDRNSLLPTSISGNVAEWKLDNVISHKSIVMLMPSSRANNELRAKVFGFLGVALLVFSVAILLPKYRLSNPLLPMIAMAAILAAPLAAAASLNASLTIWVPLVGCLILPFAFDLRKIGPPAWLCAGLFAAFFSADYTAIIMIALLAIFTVFAIGSLSTQNGTKVAPDNS